MSVPPSRAPGSSPAATLDAAKVVRLMLAFFGDSEVARTRMIEAAAMPASYRSLLAHDGHMTEVLERHHGGMLEVRPYRIHREGDIYGRRLDLHAAGVDGPIMTGIMIFNLALVAPEVREEIVAARTPLGAILIRRRILRRVVCEAFLEFDAEDPLVARFARGAARPAYGRLATIDCDQRPVVDLLEVVRP